MGNVKKIGMMSGLFLFGVLSFGNPTFAFESKMGVISQIDVFGEGNYAFRVWFTDSPSMCSLNESWAYVESGDSNYDTKVASLLSAFAMGATVGLFVEASDRGHCHLDSIYSIRK